jgi:hypothetical protein
LVNALLQEQSTSTRALLKSISKGERAFGGKSSHFPGRLDEGIRVMGAWNHDGTDALPKTLYTGKPDIVLALFNSPFGPDVLVTTDRLSEGVDLHRCCRHLIHYELDPSPVRTIQRNGRVRRVGSWAALTGQPICYAYPTFGGTRDEKAVGVMSCASASTRSAFSSVAFHHSRTTNTAPAIRASLRASSSERGESWSYSTGDFAYERGQDRLRAGTGSNLRSVFRWIQPSSASPILLPSCCNTNRKQAGSGGTNRDAGGVQSLRGHCRIAG